MIMGKHIINHTKLEDSKQLTVWEYLQTPCHISLHCIHYGLLKKAYNL